MTVREAKKKHSSHGKKTRKKERKLKEALARAARTEKKRNPGKPNFPAMQLLNDPQGNLSHCV